MTRRRNRKRRIDRLSIEWELKEFEEEIKE